MGEMKDGCGSGLIWVSAITASGTLSHGDVAHVLHYTHAGLDDVPIDLPIHAYLYLKRS